MAAVSVTTRTESRLILRQAATAVSCLFFSTSLSLNSAERQNAELAKMRQECVKLTKEVGEKTESLLATENIRKGLEAKASAAEKQLSLLQVGPGLWGLITSL